ncbi:DEAD/DEAH box helicase [Candidatus Heimdallarchaeota archaeon B3_Heim]|nr:MAG: DEAD/DEAH box helicase [Candidatus Heimdallarchaeota archaeon B3_Heim]
MISEFIKKIKNTSYYKDQIIFQRSIPEKDPQFGSLAFQLAPELEQWLRENEWKLYSHQADALNIINKGKNVVVTTSTASGKTLIFSLAVAQAITQRENSTALFLYPMKALANDQLSKMEELNAVLEGRLRPFIYDGDTPSERRPAIRNTARVIISNPYAFHRYLDWHSKWERFFRNLRFIVIDEAHTYRGVFGSNVAQLIRRLQRICEFYRSQPQFILSSATINNPREFAEKLIGTPLHIITNDGSQQGSKELVIWNPPFVDQFNSKRRSPHQETRDLLFSHLSEHYQTLCFTLSRKMSEIIAVWARQDLEKHELDPEQVMAYRAGYRPLERRRIESQLRNREISAVVSTNALEVGIDIGNLDAVLLSGFPGTIISTWQQIGRVGRTTRPSLATLILFEDAYQQFLGRHPEYFLEKTPENAIIDLNNPYIVKGHILCAASELPIKKAEISKIWGEVGMKVIKELLNQDVLKLVPAGIVPKSIKHPSQQVSLNSAFTESIEIIVSEKLLETMTTAQAYREAHEGAILIHQGEKYLIETIDWENKKAYASPHRVDYYTEAISISDVEIIAQENEKDIGYLLTFGEVKVTEFYHSYRKKTYDEVLEIVPFDLPPLEFNTKAVWINLPSSIVTKVKAEKKDFSGGIHALEHATIALSPLFALCDRWDIGGTSYPNFPDDGTAKIFIYDGFPGGIGIAEQLFEKWEVLLSNVLQLIQECPCSEGCPSCIQSPKCGNDNFPLSKEVAIDLLKELKLLSKN